jgi:L,D-peptidoglycan transpeptidase YkuD (ErfK/YbiS/YcfS/YnhG family)
MGWCDAVADRNYNRPVSLPYPASHEELWRRDGLYDVVITLSHNVRPRVRGLGSAVFFHLASPDLIPTAGCVAVRPCDINRVLCRIGPSTRLVIGR